MFGLLVMLAVVAAPWSLVSGRFTSGQAAAAALAEYLLSPRRDVALDFSQPFDVAVGDPIFWEAAPGEFRQVGELRQLVDASGNAVPARRAITDNAQAVLYPFAPPLSSEAALELYVTPGSFGWVIETLLPRQRQAEVVAELQGALAAHQAEIVSAMAPVVEAGVRDVALVVRQDLDAAVQRHAAEINALVARYEEEVVRRELLPLAANEVLPIVYRRAEPLAMVVGREIWDKVSLWRFGWRYLYDKSPLPEQRLTEGEWRRFVETDALPVLAAHSDDIVRVVRQIVDDLADNEQIRDTASRAVQRVFDDPEVRRLGEVIFDEVVVSNPRLWKAIDERFHSAEARQAFATAAARLEPALRKIADGVLGSRTSGVTREFAHVLRNQILLKDQRWLILRTGAQPAAGDVRRLPVRPGVTDPATAYPYRGADEVDGRL